MDNLPRTPEEYRRWWAENTDVPYGYCWCGCGYKTNINKGQTMTCRPVFRNQPMRYLRGHVRRKSPIDYIVNTETGCWVWQRTTVRNGDYGQMWDNGRRRPAYRVYYERAHGKVDPKHDVHHRCVEEGYGTTLCVNPEHLEALSRSQHLLRHSSS